MDNLSKWLFVFLICISLLSCSNDNDNDKIKVINLDPNGISETMPEIEIKSITKLEKRDSSIIGNIRRVDYFQGRFYILDSDESKALFIFSSEGNFISKTKYGRGPDEILDPWDFYIDQTKNEILIWDQRVLDFSEVIQKYLPINSRDILQMTVSSPICVYNGIEFIATYDQHIYRYRNNKIDTLYYLDFGKYNVTPQDINEGLYYLFDQYKQGFRIGNINNLYENDRFLSLSYLFNDTSHFFIHLKIRNRTYDSNDLIKNRLIPRCQIQTLHDNSFIAFVEPKDLIDFLSVRKEYLTLIKQPDPFDNPYIMTFNIADN
jgi:hypothetical protein